ncbi:AbgT family transporter [Acidobacteria bacterium ACD]|nr:MAG: AbgT family transporter [Acidobacteriota bacterium]MCE7957789.1 AbgT family transporter [Acidobacteria bacterium ACB2]MDL1948737.1 AbgT family transporter [Acidobacteria bacterium ACD]
MAGAGRVLLFDRFLRVVERGGNALPNPVTLFLGLAVAVVVLSAVASGLGFSVRHPATGSPIEPVNLLSVAGLHRLLEGLVKNFTSFAPLGTVLVALLGIGIAERSGLVGAAMRLLVSRAPRGALTFVVVFAGILSNAASEVGYVLLVPLSGAVFASVGRHPIAGVAAAFAGVSGGYSANLLLGTVDPLLAGLTQEAAHIVDPKYLVNPACNWYFMAVSTFVIAAVGTLVTERVVLPRLPRWEGAGGGEELRPLERKEKRALGAAGLTGAALAAVVLLGTVPDSGFLRDAQTGSLLRSPFMNGIVALVFVSSALMGLAYGVVSGSIRKDLDVVKGMNASMETMGSYLVLCFFAAQFVALFSWSNLGLIVAVEGATALEAVGLGGLPLVVSFVVLSALVNLFMGSASAKWAILAPVFVPMFMLLGYSPELTQAAYRVGDSVTNVISPTMSYFPLILAFLQRWQKDAGLGTLIATMLPYTLAFLSSWTVLLGAWYLLGLPLGPGAGLRLPGADG